MAYSCNPVQRLFPLRVHRHVVFTFAPAPGESFLFLPSDALALPVDAVAFAAGVL